MRHVAAHESEHPGETPSRAPARPLDVIVVDDEVGSRVALSAAVRVLGHDCRTAENGPEALRMHASRPADVIVSDWRMEGMDGMELCRRVRALDRGTYTYLLFTSGHASKRDFVEAVRAGADDCLRKPVDLDDLEARLIAADRVVRAYRVLAARNVGLRHDSQTYFREARVDPLTGVANRLRLDEDLAALQAHMARYGGRTCFAMCDLDQFKRYNDHYGHLAGDEALRLVASAIQSSLRRADRVYRYGGEEFLVVLPEQTLHGAALALGRVREAVERLGIAHAPETRHPVLTVSIGVAAIAARRGETPLDAVARADRALYRAKARKGNAVTTDTGGDSVGKEQEDE